MNALELQKKLIKARNGINRATGVIIKKDEKEIVDVVRQDQIFDDGLSGSGQVIGTYKVSVFDPIGHSNTKGFPKIKGTQVNLFDKGDLFKSYRTKYSNFILKIFPTDKKRKLLENKYGNDTFFANEESENTINEKVKPKLQTFIKRTIR